MDPVAGHIRGARNAPFNAPDAITDDVLAASEPPIAYCGSGVTAAALVLQVLHVVEANLLAAYSSNLLGIVTVALIKIRHVRPIKRELILEGQAEAAAAPQR